MKKAVKSIITIIIAVALFLGIGVLLRYLMFDDVDSYSRLMFHDLHNAEENIDILFVGSSHVRRSIDPRITDELFGANTFNCGTAAQRIDGSLGMIREACRDNDVKQIYLDLYHYMVDTSFQKRKDMTATYLVTDYMKPSIDRIRYILSASRPKYYSNGFILARRNWEQLFDTQYMADLFARKQEQTYRNYEWTDKGDGDYYVDKGFFTNDWTIRDEVKMNTDAFGPIEIVDAVRDKDGDWHKTLQEIIDFCADREIELVLYVTPESEWSIVGKWNYQEYSDAVREIADENHIPFYDFNLVKPEYFDASDMSQFLDTGHFNTKGAQAFSNLIGEFFAGGLKGQSIFYDTLADKLAAEEPRVYGAAKPQYDAEGYYYMYLVSNRMEGIEYKITTTSYATGEREIQQDFEEDIYFYIPSGESGKAEIRWRVIGEPDVHVFEIEY